MAVQSPPKPNPTPPKEPESDIQEYVVLVAAITFATGKGRNKVQRFTRGTRLRLHSGEERVQELVRSKSIGVRGEKYVRSTPMTIFRSLGAADDPAEPPLQSVQPIVPDKAVTTV